MKTIINYFNRITPPASTAQRPTFRALAAFATVVTVVFLVGLARNIESEFQTVLAPEEAVPVVPALAEEATEVVQNVTILQP